METRAPYALIGLFVVAAIVAVFGFVYWLNHTGGLGERTTYRLRFEQPVSGMLVGSAVLFNGIKVGEVTDLRLNPDDPGAVMVTIAVTPDTPIRSDTRAGLDFQGLTGVAVVALNGGTAAGARLAAAGGEVPVIDADPMASQSMTTAARSMLQRLDALVAENAEALRAAIANIETFSQALARNSDRIDNIAAGLERMTGGGPAAEPPVAYTLPVPEAFPSAPKKAAQVEVPEPAALLMFDTQKILIRPTPGHGPTFARAQWGDTIPKLVQAKVVQAFENAGYLDVSRPIDGLASDYKLIIDIRSFQISTAAAPTAEVDLSARLVSSDGKLVASHVFRSAVPADVTNASAAADSLGKAFAAVAFDLVTWTAGAI